MCSTPCGITEVARSSAIDTASDTACRAQRLAASLRSAPVDYVHRRHASPSAQRLAASQRSAHVLRVQPVQSRGCSTPCGITEVGTSWRSSHRGRTGLCSTPCGITEVGTARQAGASGPHELCSTPCGITEVGTGRFCGRVLRSVRAQRLAASQRSAPVDLSTDRSATASCSTPCGITRSAPRPLARTTRRARCAQRLAASQRLALHGSAAAPRSRSCAQRLAASQRSALPTGHGRLSRSLECSTPCGITEVGTVDSDQHPTPDELCSTPCGITEVGTLSSGRRCFSATACAQRLAASQRSAPRMNQDTANAMSRVLNALRHH